MSPAAPSLAAWGGTSRTVDLDGPVHYVDFGGPADGSRVVFVHGLGGSHLNWCLTAPRLSSVARMLAPDLGGFGLTAPGRRQTTVEGNTRLLDRFLREVAGAPAVLVGNSMGGMISLLEAAAHPDAVAGVVLIDPALPLARGARLDGMVATAFALYAVPGLGERVMARRNERHPARALVEEVLERCCVDPSRVPEDVVAACIALAEQRAGMPGLEAAFLAAARSLLRVLARRERYREAMRAVRAPVLLLHGEQDRLVSVHSARAAAAANPAWRLEVLPGVGHVPQLEAPDETAALILDWLGREGAEAAGAVRAR